MVFQLFCIKQIYNRVAFTVILLFLFTSREIVTMDEKLRERINSIMVIANGLDWTQPEFSVKKAQVCAELCALVYNHVRPYELKKASRIHLFASNEFRAIVASGSGNSIQEELLASELGSTSFILAGRYVIILGVRLSKVLLLTVRGTVMSRLWDWRANVDTRKYYQSFDSNKIVTDTYYHWGFLNAIAPQFPSIADKIVETDSTDYNIPIVWTGHSLGGAMAATAHSINKISRQLRATTNHFYSKYAYTFGMPRYAGLGVIVNTLGPYHLYKRQDLVPTVPLRSMGFSDPTREYVISDDNKIELAERTDTFGLLGHMFKVRSSLAAHAIEGYAQSIADSLGVPRPGI
jgi:hypothetical protein